MPRTPIATPNAPQAIGTYSQAMRAGDTVYLSGQIPLDPATGELVAGDMEAQVRRVFENLKAVAAAAGSDLDHAVRVTVYLTDLQHFALVNRVMAQYFSQPYPARAALGVAALPKGAAVEIDAILEL
jgi:reactive intermediate/imine deaminase